MAEVKLLTCNGETLSIADWARKLKMDQSSLSYRLNSLGWDTQRALTTPVANNHAKRPPRGREAFLAACDGSLTVEQYLAMDAVEGDDDE